MKSKVQEKERVQLLRKRGFTYREILKVVPVSKSSVSAWLRESPLTSREKQLLKDKREAGISRGRIRAATSLRAARESRDRATFDSAKEVFTKHVSEPRFQLGVGLYWAEGSKRSNCFGFINSDPEMIGFMLSWIRHYLIDDEEEIRMRVYTHKSFAHEHHEKAWAKVTGIPLSRFGSTVFKSQGLMVKKRPNYMGCVRIELGRVKRLRAMAYWQQMLIEHYKKER